ncbi:YihY/virulence factor BrkB family protein [Haloarchaeobius sp. TZWWS8]|uniref:YihY/virulence factor BrkB family protein n=1 Tax=Haloarchaeobius sp. TZWWS8 TaxID=3446121 RepID=UPI003EB8B42E
MSLPPWLERLRGTVAAVVALAQAEQLTFLAAAIAYYAFVSLVPLVVLAVAIAAVVGGEAFADDVVAIVGDTLTPASQDVLRSALTASDGRSSATVVGLAFVIWSGLKVFRALDRGFSAVYGNGLEEGLVAQLSDAALALAAVGLAAVAAATVVAIVGLVPLPFGQFIAPLLSLGALAFAFYPLYYLFPDVTDMDWREALPGAIFAAVAWTVMGLVFGIYANQAAATNLYGFFGAILLLTTWLYLGALVLLVGAALNAALAGRTGHLDTELSADVDRHLQTAGLRQDEPTENDV